MSNQTEYLNLIVRYLNNPHKAKLQSEITSFRAESAGNDTYFREIERIWLFSSASARLDSLDVKQAEKDFKVLLRSAPSTASKLILWLAGIAACVTLAIIGLTFFNSEENIKTFTVKTGKGQIDTISLADGSKVILAENSEFKYPSRFNSSSREVTLNGGKAFFLIAKDTKHTFRVNMGKSRVSVLGTSFNLTFSQSNIELDVKTGRVMFRPDETVTSSILSAGQGISYSIDRKQLLARRSQNSDAWITKALIFVDTPLEEVCKQLSDCYGVKITFDAGNRVNKKFNATFKNEDLNDILKVLEHTYDLKVNHQGDSLTLKTP